MTEGIPSISKVVSGSLLGEDAISAEQSIFADRRTWGLTWIELFERCLYRPTGSVLAAGLYAIDPHAGIVSHWIDTQEGQESALLGAMGMDLGTALLLVCDDSDLTSAPWTLKRGLSDIRRTGVVSNPSGNTALEASLCADLNPRKPSLSLRSLLLSVVQAVEGEDLRCQLLLSQRSEFVAIATHSASASRPWIHLPTFGSIESNWIFAASLSAYP